MKQNIVLGIDIGGVIISPSDERGSDTSFFSNNYLKTPVMDGAFDAIAALVAQRFGSNTYIVSKCGPVVQDKSLRWLESHGFFARTGIAPDHVRFCLTRKDKAPICAELGITHFIDDKLEVLSYLTTVPTRILFKPRPAEVARHAQFLPDVTRVETWPEATAVLLA